MFLPYFFYKQATKKKKKEWNFVTSCAGTQYSFEILYINNSIFIFIFLAIFGFLFSAQMKVVTRKFNLFLRCFFVSSPPGILLPCAFSLSHSPKKDTPISCIFVDGVQTQLVDDGDVDI